MYETLRNLVVGTSSLLVLNTREGAATASLYDIAQNPGLLVLRDDGQLVAEWRGSNLPLMNEVAGYLT